MPLRLVTKVNESRLWTRSAAAVVFQVGLEHRDLHVGLRAVDADVEGRPAGASFDDARIEVVQRARRAGHQDVGVDPPLVMRLNTPNADVSMRRKTGVHEKSVTTSAIANTAKNVATNASRWRCLTGPGAGGCQTRRTHGSAGLPRGRGDENPSRVIVGIACQNWK